MASDTRIRTTPRRIRVRRARAACVLVAGATIAAFLGFRSAASSPSGVVSPPDVVRTTSSVATPSLRPGAMPRLSRGGGPLGEADGAVPDGTSVFDDGVPGVARLDPRLLAALRRAAVTAARDGIELRVDSGWRSAGYQGRLLREAVAKYGSEDEAARWVATPETSAHVSGDAVDVGPAAAAAWLSDRGAWYGLCRIYGNEPWHFELRPDAVARGCPSMYADPTHDPRMRR